ncbi:ParB/RepB/Spo0J family partition protein [Geobacter hydrogenophilus]|uniref:Chromosome partitioning protein ParB n=1 Tax=Geobacter hydrogenophilus TaxID=40983 RepID=A0A9W6LCY8_9BACT|nr:ParB/RepB/Spo0J family partition protein [Geobacter hydrogenophilus]MBT0893399.1 ParB/RepB/Spo0J family partition protein [Geobacter hydrogenophilus]GLI37906.1 chromosome partitioning protein ParB [Geobacter hydrogenophilus]
MVRKTGLGKGMAALLPVVEEEGKRYFSCPIEEIRPNRNQPRKTFTPDRLEELAASIREKGIIQPLVVRKKGDHYELIAGERRWRAAQKAGLREVPVVIQDVSEDTALEMALIENIQREDLNAVEEAEAYHALMENFSLTQDELAKRVGKDRSTVANSLRLLKLPAELKKDIVEERLAMGHARAILALDTDLQMREARDAVVKGNLTVREAESLVKRLKGEQKPKPKAAAVEVHAADLVEQLQRRFMTKIAVRKSGKGGKIEIAYGSRDELARIVDLLLG